jgi:hypothetical protein
MRVGPTIRDGNKSTWELTWAGPITLSERAQAGGGPTEQDLRAVADVYHVAYCDRRGTCQGGDGAAWPAALDRQPMDCPRPQAGPAQPSHTTQGWRVAVASIEKRVRNGRTTYRVRYRDPADHQRSKVFDRKVDAEK